MAETIVVPASGLGFALVASDRPVTKLDKDAFLGRTNAQPMAISGTLGCVVDAKVLAAHLLKREMPGFVGLHDLALKHAPPSDYFDGDMERPW